MKFIPTSLPEVVIIEPDVFGDDRGWFMESFSERKLHEGLNKLGLPSPKAFVQDNESHSKAGVLRGLHHQLPPHAQGKLVRVVCGAVRDVAIDIRSSSPRFGQWTAVELTAQNKRQLWIPEGFAHGFLTLVDDTRFLYKTTDFYTKDCERAIRWNDPTIGIDWALGATQPQLAEKDAIAPLLVNAESH